MTFLLLKNEVIGLLSVNALKRGLSLAIVFSALAISNFAMRFNEIEHGPIYVVITNLLSLSYTLYSTNVISINPALNLLIPWSPLEARRLIAVKNAAHFSV
jgi:uncharacterized membrane protein (UPF0136 family)